MQETCLPPLGCLSVSCLPACVRASYFFVLFFVFVCQHDGWVDLSDVEGMLAKDGSGKSINDVGRVKIKTCTKKVLDAYPGVRT